MKTMTQYKPILFRGEFVRRIMKGLKTQTRRVMKLKMLPRLKPLAIGCPYGEPGDRLWVRETFALYSGGMTDCGEEWSEVKAEDGPVHEEDGYTVEYKADLPESNCYPDKWRPSIFMPRWACRLELEIVNVRVERLQDISEEDAKAEGVQVPITTEGCPPGTCHYLYNALTPYKALMSDDHAFRAQFAYVWDTINKKRGFGWDANPWLWVLDFKRVKCLSV